MSTVLLVIHIMIAIALVVVILIQRSSSDGLGGLGGGGNAFLSGRASANLLTHTTAVLATLFILNSLALATIASRTSSKDSLIQTIEEKGSTEQTQEGKNTDVIPENKTPSTPSVPIAQ